MYSESLEVPLRRSNRNAIWSNALYAISQALVFFVIALVFWYGAILVSQLQASTFHFFAGLMVSPDAYIVCDDGSPALYSVRRLAPFKLAMSFRLFLMYLLRKVPDRTLSSYLTPYRKSMQSPRKERRWNLRRRRDICASNGLTSVTQRGLLCAYCESFQLRFNRALTSL